MELEALLEALTALQANGGEHAAVAGAARAALAKQPQLLKDLEQARDEASMKPSVARKLNQKIRELEAEVEQLRSDKQVKSLEKKVQFLEQELRQSYTTKNFTLKSGLLELEKAYRADMDSSPSMAAFWADIALLLDEKRDAAGCGGGASPFRGPPGSAASATPGRTPRTSASAAAAEAPADGNAAAGADSPQPGAACSSDGRDASVQPHAPSAGVQSQVEAFSSIISAEAASAAAAMPEGASHAAAAAGAGEAVLRQAGSFRIVRAPGAAAAAAGGSAAGGAVVAESLPPASLLDELHAARLQEVAFQPLPSALTQRAQQQQQPGAAGASGSDLLLDALADFVSQLERQGLLQAASSSAGASGGGAQQQPLLQLLRSWLAVNPGLLQLLAPPPPPSEPPQVEVGHASVQHEPQSAHAAVQHAAEAAHAATQHAAEAAHAASQHEPEPGVHAETQVDGPESAHASVQAGATPQPVHAATQHAAEAAHAASQHEPEPGVHAETQASRPESAHASAQAGATPQPVHAATQHAAEAAHAASQHEPEPGMHAETQASRPESAHASAQAGATPQPVHAAVQHASEAVHAASQHKPEPGVHTGTQHELPEQVQALADGGCSDGDTAAATAGSASTAAQKPRGRPGADDALDAAGLALPPERPDCTPDSVKRSGSGIIYAGSGSELSVAKVAVGQQLDILDQLQRRSAGAGSAPDSADGGAQAAAAMLDVRPEELGDLAAVAQELTQLRADNLELAASLQVTKSLVDHLNAKMQAAIDKADDAESDAAQAQRQLGQLQAEHAELTHTLIEAKVELAERQGELLALVRDMRRALAGHAASGASAAGVVKELADILAVVPGDEAGLGSPLRIRGSGSFGDMGHAAPAGSRLAGLRAGLNQAFESLRAAGAGGQQQQAAQAGVPPRLSDPAAVAAAAAPSLTAAVAAEAAAAAASGSSQQLGSAAASAADAPDSRQTSQAG